MKFYRNLLLSFLASALFANVSQAGEASIPGPKPKAKVASVKKARFDGAFRSNRFISSVDGQENEWRSVIRQEGDAVRIGLKTGTWERPDSIGASKLWLSYNLDWATVDSSGKAIRYIYEFGASTEGVTSVFRFGCSRADSQWYDGDYALKLVYGQNTCTFSVGDKETSGQLPFEITDGARIEITVAPDNTADISINDTPIIADQVIESEDNYISITAIGQNPAKPQMLHIKAARVQLVSPE